MLLHGILLLVELIRLVFAHDNVFIRDYFLYKNVKSIVGFSCNNENDDFNLVRLMNDVGIKASVKEPSSRYTILNLLARPSNKLGIFLDARCGHDVVKIFNESSDQRMYNYGYNWLILAPNLTYSVSTLNDSAFSFETDFVIATKSDKIITLFDVYNPCKYRSGLMNITLLGSWTTRDGFNITLKDSFFNRRRNFHGMRIGLGSLIGYRPQNMTLTEFLEDENTRHLDSVAKFGYALLSHVLDMYNMTADLREYTIWEKNNKNGPVISNLSSLSIDFGYNLMVPTKERCRAARLLLQAWPLRSCFFLRVLPSKKLKMEKILRPMSSSSWFVIGLSSAFCAFIFSIILRVERTRKIAESVNYGNPVLVTFGSLCQQGVSSCSNNLASRIAFLNIMIFGLLLYNYYGAAIVSARVHEPLERFNDSLYSLVQSKLQMASAKTLFFNVLIQDPKWEVQYFKKHWDTLSENKQFLPIAEGVRKVEHGDFAFHSDPNDAYPLMERMLDDQTICRLSEIHLLRPIMVTFFTTKNEQFVEISKIGLLRTFSAGLRKRQLIRWKSRTPYCNLDALGVEAITIYDVAPMLTLLCVGFSLSLVFFVTEVLIFHVKRLRKQYKMEKKQI